MVAQGMSAAIQSRTKLVWLGGGAVGTPGLTATSTGGVVYFPFAVPSPASSTANATEANVLTKVPAATTVRALSISVSANASTADVTFTLRKAGADASLAVTVTAGATGQFAFTGGSVVYSAGNTISVKASQATTGNLTVDGLYAELE